MLSVSSWSQFFNWNILSSSTDINIFQSKILKITEEIGNRNCSGFSLYIKLHTFQLEIFSKTTTTEGLNYFFTLHHYYYYFFFDISYIFSNHDWLWIYTLNTEKNNCRVFEILRLLITGIPKSYKLVKMRKTKSEKQ